jgi:hypothetical protein
MNIVKSFRKIGFAVAEGPEVEDDLIIVLMP